jgi:hypothetical protein
MQILSKKYVTDFILISSLLPLQSNYYVHVDSLTLLETWIDGTCIFYDMNNIIKKSPLTLS